MPLNFQEQKNSIAALKQKRLSWLHCPLTNIQAILDVLAGEEASSSFLWTNERIPFDTSDVKEGPQPCSCLLCSIMFQCEVNKKCVWDVEITGFNY